MLQLYNNVKEQKKDDECDVHRGGEAILDTDTEEFHNREHHHG
jgi:hypothetical protein